MIGYPLTHRHELRPVIPFLAAVITSAAALAGFLVWTTFRLGGDATTVAVEDTGEAVAALVAAAACAYAARRSRGQVRSAWRLLALSAASWMLGEATWSIYEVGLGIAVPFLSWADLGFIASYALAVAGILSFPWAPQTAMNRGRALIDGAIVAASLIFVSWSFGLEDAFNLAGTFPAARVIAIGYPAGDLVLITLLALLLRSAHGKQRVPVVLLIAAFAAILMADTSFAFLTLQGSYGILGSSYDGFWVAGFLILGLASLYPVAIADETRAEGPVEPWQLAMPWLAVLALFGAAGWLVATGQPVDSGGTALAETVGLLFVLSQALTLRDSVRLISASRYAERQLRERTALLNEVIARAPMGIARVGVNLRVIDANPSLCALLYSPSRLLLGSSITEYLSDEEFGKLRGRFASLRDGSAETVEGDSQVRRVDASTVWLHWSVTAVRRSGGQVDYYLAMFEDITAKHEAEQTALANLAGLERLSRLKSEFMSMVSHEFRTALTGIQGYSEVLQTEDVNPGEVKEFAGDINSDAQRLNRMITEMLDLDRIESGRITLHPSRLDLNRMLKDTVERARITTSHHDIRTDLDPALPEVDGDADRLVQVVTNLLSNAIKYSPGGGEIIVTSRAVQGDVEVTVKDHGQGIPPEFASRIFGRYERYEPNGKSQVVGTGLGLAIAQQIIQLHKGRIWVVSQTGEGSAFHFAIPAPPLNEVAPGSETQAVASASAAGVVA